MIPQMAVTLGILLLIVFLTSGGIDDIPENITILIIGAVVGGGLVFTFK